MDKEIQINVRKKQSIHMISMTYIDHLEHFVPIVFPLE